LPAVLVLALLGALAEAEQLRVHKAYYDAESLFEATQQLSADLGRLPIAAEWPEILLAAPIAGVGWRGPYISGMKKDGWNNPYRFRSDVAGPGTFGIYSVGVNGIDEGGEGDEVSSWQGYHPRFYPETRRWGRLAGCWCRCRSCSCCLGAMYFSLGANGGGISRSDRAQLGQQRLDPVEVLFSRMPQISFPSPCQETVTCSLGARLRP